MSAAHRCRRALRVLAVLAAGLGACADEQPDDGLAPVVRAVRPPQGRAGDPVTLLGRGFGLRGPGDGVWLGGVEAAVESWEEAALLVRVPADAGPGRRDFVVRAGPYVSRPVVFEVLVE